MKVLLFSNLYPSSLLPNHGSFVRERIERLRARMGFEYRVIHPVPLYPPMPGKSSTARHSRLPRHERVDGIEVFYPRYLHIPRYGVHKHGRRVTNGARKVFARQVAEFRPDLVDAHYLYPDGVAAVTLAQEHGLPCLVTARGSDATVLPGYPAVRAHMREVLPRARRLLAVSSDLAATTAEVCGLDAPDVWVAPNGVDLDRFHPSRQAPLRRLVTVGQLIPRKRLDLLLRALADPAGSELPALTIVGDGPMRSELTALTRKLGIEGRVTFYGEASRQGVADELAKGGVFAFPTRLEGYPNAVLEGLAAGCPVVATSVNGIPDILGDSAAGRQLAREDGPEAWARSLAAMVADFDRDPAGMRDRARARAEQLSWTHTMELLERAFEEAVR